MIHTLLGEENFQKGMQLYFERHDGSAATCDDFVQAMEDASNVDLSHFRRWYSQSGTPIVTVKDDYNPETEQIPDHQPAHASHAGSGRKTAAAYSICHRIV
ncbi:M1 family aminopeptidase [Escherichia coli]